jgi:hypothetical protein
VSPPRQILQNPLPLFPRLSPVSEHHVAPPFLRVFKGCISPLLCRHVVLRYLWRWQLTETPSGSFDSELDLSSSHTMKNPFPTDAHPAACCQAQVETQRPINTSLLILFLKYLLINLFSYSGILADNQFLSEYIRTYIATFSELMPPCLQFL